MKPSEKRLLFGLLLMLLIGAGVIGSDYYFDKRDQLLADKVNLDNEWITSETLFEEKEVWEMRAAWLEQHQPVFTSTEEIDQAIFKEALAAEVDGVGTSKHTLLPTANTPYYTQAGVSISAAGDLASVFRWLSDLNRPESFHVIRNIKVGPDKDKAENIVAQLELLRWYTPAPGAEITPDGSDAEPES